MARKMLAKPMAKCPHCRTGYVFPNEVIKINWEKRLKKYQYCKMYKIRWRKRTEYIRYICSIY